MDKICISTSNWVQIWNLCVIIINTQSTNSYILYIFWMFNIIYCSGDVHIYWSFGITCIYGLLKNWSMRIKLCAQISKDNILSIIQSSIIRSNNERNLLFINLITMIFYLMHNLSLSRNFFITNHGVIWPIY